MAVSAKQIKAAEDQIIEQSRKIDFFLTEYTVELLAQKMKNKEFEIPAYQREDTWEPERKSRFIESLLMGLPIPFLFFWEKPDTGKLEIVDGAQRLRTIEQFVLGDFVLGKLDTLTELEGMKFCDLPESRQRKVRNRSVRGIVLNEHADDLSRFEIFDRINTGSKIANNAEVRRGALTGQFLTLVIELAREPLLAELAPMPEKSVKLREREELVTRFFAYSDGLEGYKDRPSPFLYQYARKKNEDFTQHPRQVAQYRKRFMDTMAFVKKTFPYGFARKQGGQATPRTRFEAISIGSYLALHKKPDLAKSTVNVRWLESHEFRDIIGSDGANVISKLRGRLYFVRDKLMGV